MKIIVQETKRALTPTEWNDVPPFAVLCGQNGAGKSQFLQEMYKVYSKQLDQGERLVIAVEGDVLEPQQVLHLTSEWHVDDAMPMAADWVGSRKATFWQNYPHYKNGHDHNSPFRSTYLRLERDLGVAQGHLTFQQMIDGITDDEVIEASPGSLQHVSQVFARYRTKVINARLRQETPDLGDAPWKRLNRLLAVAGLPYRCNEPDTFSSDRPFLLEFEHNDGAGTVVPRMMSSGEKVIINLFLLLFSAQEGFHLPKLLLLDEPDAHLHPSMVRRFVQALETVLVREEQMQVIMTTHSPTTVAVCSEIALFEMKPFSREPGDRIVKISRDRAIGMLTDGVPALRVLLENRRQVLVENDSDAQVYSALALHLKTRLDPKVSLEFIGVGDPRKQEPSGCSRVREWTERFAEAGNTTIVGLVDWDLIAEPDGRLRVLAQGSRYSIENCVLDPRVVAAMLTKHRLLDDEFADLNFVGLTAADATTWQRLVDHVCTTVRSCLKKADDDTLVDCKSIDGLVLRVPAWYLRTRGHTLEEAVIAAFPGLQRVTRGGGAGRLCWDIADHVGAELPGAFPQALLDAFTDLGASALDSPCANKEEEAGR